MKIFAILYAVLFTINLYASQSLEIVERNDDSPVHNVSSEDEAMNAAMDKARKTVELLISNFKEIKEKGYPMSVKVNLFDDNHSEHFWLSDITLDNGVFKGRLDNNPLHLKQYKLGQKVQVKSEEISDWFLIVGQDIYGATTMQVARSRMNAQQRNDFDNSFPYLKLLEQKIENSRVAKGK